MQKKPHMNTTKITPITSAGNPACPSIPASPPPLYLGVDIAKAELVLDLQGTILRFENTPQGIIRLCAQISKLSAPHLILEATAGYERALLLYALERGIAISLIQPARVRHYARALNLLAKSDPIDARLLSRFGRDINPAPAQPREPVRDTLCELLTRRNQLLDLLTCENNRAAHHTAKLALRQHRTLVSLIEKQITALEKETAALIDTDPALHAADTLLRTVVGVGPQTSRILLAALSAARCNPILKPFYQRHHHARQLHGIEENLTEQKFIRPVGKPANDVTMQGVSNDRSAILALPSLPPAIHRGNGEPLRSKR